MLEKLQIVEQRFDEVSDLIVQPDIISDQKRYIDLNKEYKELSILVEKIKIYKKILQKYLATMKKSFQFFIDILLQKLLEKIGYLEL